MLTLSIALKNIRANKKRAAVTTLLISIPTALLVFASAFMDGSHNQMIRSALEIYPGYLQITHKDFRETPSYDNLIFDLGPIKASLARIPGISTYASRFEAFVLFATAEKSVGGMLTGIEPAKEMALSRLESSLVAGRYLTTEDSNALYIGKELAKRLGLGVGDELSFIGSGADYSFAADTLIVKGIFQTGLFEFDASASFMNKRYFDQIMASAGLATHIIVLPEDPRRSAGIAEAIRPAIGPDYSAEDWMSFMGGLVEAMEVDSIFGYITLGIISVVIFFVIIIYTLLAMFARIREIGILRAIGTTPGQILTMLLSESSILALISVLVGGLLGGGLAYYFQINPIVYSGYEEQFKQYGLAMSAMPAEFAPLTILRDMAIMFALSILATLYPILKVNSYKPIEAIYHV
jgi:ABC-type lipoprotein release transport system permease subunit